MSAVSAPVLIAGGGIGGLTAALCLARAGFKVRLFEHAAMLSEIGAGLQLPPNASRVLQRLGVMRHLDGQLGQPERLCIYSGINGNVLATMPLGISATQRWGAPYCVAHRADLQSALAKACNETGNIDTSLGCEIGRYDVTAQGVTLRFAANGGMHGAEGMALIGADGIWSKVRAQFLSDGAPRATGFNAYRAVIPANALPKALPLNSSGLWMAPDAHMVHYPLRDGTLINIVVILKDADDAQGWDSDVDLQAFYVATAHLPRVARELIRAPDSWSRWTIHDRPVSDSAWPQTPVTLLGDAAHPMLPFLAQGAAQAIEDADMLTKCLVAGSEDPARAFQAYRQQRTQCLVRVQKESERNRDIFHMGGLSAYARDAVLRFSSTQSLMKRYDWLYGSSS